MPIGGQIQHVQSPPQTPGSTQGFDIVYIRTATCNLTTCQMPQVSCQPTGWGRWCVNNLDHDHSEGIHCTHITWHVRTNRRTFAA